MTEGTSPQHQMSADIEDAVAQAWEQNPAKLVWMLNAMQVQIQGLEERQIVMADLPVSVQSFFAAIGSVSRAPGRPTKEKARLLAVRRAYDRAAARYIFYRRRNHLAGMRMAGGKEMWGRGSYMGMSLFMTDDYARKNGIERLSAPLNTTPSERALELMSASCGLSEDTLRDLVYPDRRKPKK